MKKQTIIVLGTKSGLGKTTLAKQLAQELGLKYIDGDYLKPREFKKNSERFNLIRTFSDLENCIFNNSNVVIDTPPLYAMFCEIYPKREGYISTTNKNLKSFQAHLRESIKSAENNQIGYKIICLYSLENQEDKQEIKKIQEWLKDFPVEYRETKQWRRINKFKKIKKLPVYDKCGFKRGFILGRIKPFALQRAINEITKDFMTRYAIPCYDGFERNSMIKDRKIRGYRLEHLRKDVLLHFAVERNGVTEDKKIHDYSIETLEYFVKKREGFCHGSYQYEPKLDFKAKFIVWLYDAENNLIDYSILHHNGEYCIGCCEEEEYGGF